MQTERWRSYKKIEREHRDWDHSAIAVTAAQLSNHPLEKPMSLSDDSSECHCHRNQKSVSTRNQSIKLLRGGCSNLAENFWSVVTKFSHHKGINQDHSDHYKVSNKAAFIRIGVGNVEKAHDQVPAKLGLPISSMPEKHHALRYTKMNKNKIYHQRKQAKKNVLLLRLLDCIRWVRLNGRSAIKAERCHSTKMKSQTLKEEERRVPESHLTAEFANKLGIHVGNVRCRLL